MGEALGRTLLRVLDRLEVPDVEAQRTTERVGQGEQHGHAEHGQVADLVRQQRRADEEAAAHDRRQGRDHRGPGLGPGEAPGERQVGRDREGDQDQHQAEHHRRMLARPVVPPHRPSRPDEHRRHFSPGLAERRG